MDLTPYKLLKADHEPEGWPAIQMRDVTALVGEIEQLQQQNAELKEKYHELLFGVAQKFPDESRHQTALRYIQQREAEAVSGEGCADNSKQEG